MKQSATFWLIAAFAAIALPFAVLMIGVRPSGSEFLWDFSKGLGFAALAAAGMQFALTARFRRMTYPFGIDIIYQFHRWMAWGALALILGHFGILYFWYEDALGELNPLVARWELTSGRLALLAFGALIVTSELRRWLGIEYGWWRVLHAVLGVIAFAAALAHVAGVGVMSASAGKRALLALLMGAWVGLIIWVRIGKPLIQKRNPWRLVSNEDERGDVFSLRFRPEGAGIERWNPGQFVWLTMYHSPFGLREHPFTIASAPEDGPEITLTIKPLGDFTEKLAEAKPGETAYIDGPYGVFSTEREPDAEGFVFIAGGVGITPIMSNLRSLAARGDRRPLTLIFANEDWDEVPLRDELDDLAGRLDLKLVHVIEEPPQDWDSGEKTKSGAIMEKGRVDKDLLARHLGDDTRDYPHFLCGPVPMTDAARDALTDMGVSLWRIENEIFEMV